MEKELQANTKTLVQICTGYVNPEFTPMESTRTCE